MKGANKVQKSIIPVVFAADENYVPYCGVAISSLIKHTSIDNEYKIYVLYDRLPSSDIIRLERLTTANAAVQCVCVHEAMQARTAREYNHLTIASAYRLVITDMLPQYDKIIYLDSDIVIRADIAQLYDMDIGDNILGAAHGCYDHAKTEFMHSYITKRLKIKIDNFFNAGILIINTKAFREENIAEKCFSLLRGRRKLVFMDQCALNIVCENRVFFIPKEWNYEWLFLFFPESSMKRNPEAVFEILSNPALVHYSGIEKPWQYPNMPLAEIFWQYARESVFYEEILLGNALYKTKELLELLGITCKYENIIIYGAGNAGKRYVKKIRAMKLCNIVLWCDKNYCEKTGYELPVESIERIFTTKFDHILIAIENTEISNQVRGMLLSRNVDSEKILQIRRN